MTKHHPDSKTDCAKCGLTFYYRELRKQNGVLRCRDCLIKRVRQIKRNRM